MREGLNPWFLLVLEAACILVHVQRGGVYHNFRLKCITTTFLYLSHSAVVIPFESALALRTREKGGDESAPPQNRGGHVTLDSGAESTETDL